MLTLVTCMGGVDVDTGPHAWEEWMLTLITCMEEWMLITGPIHGRSEC